MVFTSRDAWILSLLDHTRGASQCFPSSADIFLVMPFPPQPFPWSSPRSNRAALAVDAQPQVQRGGSCWPAWSQPAPLPAWGGSPMPGTGTLSCSPQRGSLGCQAGYCIFFYLGLQRTVICAKPVMAKTLHRQACGAKFPTKCLQSGDGDRRQVNLQAATRTLAGRASVQTGRVVGAQDAWVLRSPRCSAAKLSLRSPVRGLQRRWMKPAPPAARQHGQELPTGQGEGKEGRFPSICFSHVFPERWGSLPGWLLAEVSWETCKQP